MVAALLALPLAGGCKKQQAAPPPQTPNVSVVTVSPQRLVLTTELPGRASAYRISEVRPQVSGLIQKRLFTEGADVKAGDVLYQIDAAPFQAAYNSALASLDAAEKSADKARAAYEASAANVARQEATLKLAETNLKRLEDLLKERAVSEVDVDTARTAVEVAKAGLNAVTADERSAKASIAAADAAIKQAEAAAQSSKINLGYTRIVAPISGRIGISSVTEGAAVTAYQPLALATITQLDPIYIDVPQSTSEISRLRGEMTSGTSARQQGLDKVKITLPDGDYSQTAKLEFRDVTVDSTTGSVMLRIVAPNPDGVLLPGMFVRATIEEAVHEDALLVPQQAVSRDGKGTPTVMLVDADGKVQPRRIETSRAVKDMWFVTSGLKAGDQVITEGLQTVGRVPPGTPVKVIAPATAPAPAATGPTASAN